MTKPLVERKYIITLGIAIIVASLVMLDLYQFKRYNQAVQSHNDLQDVGFNALYKELQSIVPLNPDQQALRAISLIRANAQKRLAYIWFSPYLSTPLYQPSILVKSGSGNKSYTYSKETLNLSKTVSPEIINLYKTNYPSFLNSQKSLESLKFSYPAISVFIFSHRLEAKTLIQEKEFDDTAQTLLSQFEPSNSATWLAYYKMRVQNDALNIKIDYPMIKLKM